MKTIDTLIIGAGPCGIACAMTLAKKGGSLALVEVGNDYAKRYCHSDHGRSCANCENCSVISGFGGCVDYGDSAKLSYYPSGKALYKKVQKDYEDLKNKAVALWGIDDPARFIYTELDTESYGFETKAYPVCVMGSDEIRARIEYFYKTIIGLGVEYIHDEMLDFTSDAGMHKVSFKSGEEILCKNLVLAMGRRGVHWLHANAVAKGFSVNAPESTIGFRFEMPMKYLTKVGAMHPDFKARAFYNGYKYKSFCYCGGANGGRLKFENYWGFILLDGHVLAESDEANGYGNFALLRQMNPLKRNTESDELKPEEIIKKYMEVSGGQTIYQSYHDFKNRVDSTEGSGTSAKFIRPGAVYKLIGDGLDDFCNVVERIFAYLADQNGVSRQEIEDNINVVALELEGLWNQVETDENFLAREDGVYVGGDCEGEAQGIIQATIMGIKIAECIE